MTDDPSYLLLDTAVLLLLLVARVDVELLFSFKRMSIFEVGDQQILHAILQRYGHIITTPHVLAEVSNFVDQAPPHRRRALIAALRAFVLEQQEHYERATTLVTRAEFDGLGMADTGLLSLSFRATVLTTDARLYARILNSGGTVLNFSHQRGYAMPNGKA